MPQMLKVEVEEYVVAHFSNSYAIRARSKISSPHEVAISLLERERKSDVPRVKNYCDEFWQQQKKKVLRKKNRYP